jgi:hypothetical protein
MGFPANKIRSAVMMVELVSAMMSHIIPTDRWCDIIVLCIVHAPTEKSDNGFYKNLLWDFNSKVCMKLVIKMWLEYNESV